MVDKETKKLVVKADNPLAMKIYELQKYATKDSHNTGGGTPGYKPLEGIICKQPLTTSVDTWAAGVILLQFITGVYYFFHLEKEGPEDLEKFKNTKVLEFIFPFAVFFGRTQVMKFCNYFGAYLRIPEGFPQDQKMNFSEYFLEHIKRDANANRGCIDLVDGLLNLNPAQRMTAAEALQNQFFDEVRDMIARGEKPNLSQRKPDLNPLTNNKGEITETQSEYIVRMS